MEAQAFGTRAFVNRPESIHLDRSRNMSPTNNPRPQGTPVQPKLSSLLARYLDRQASAHNDGLAAAEIGEVVPYEVGPVQPNDARPAWEESVAGGQRDSPRAPRCPRAPPEVGPHVGAPVARTRPPL